MGPRTPRWANKSPAALNHFNTARLKNKHDLEVQARKEKHYDQKDAEIRELWIANLSNFYELGDNAQKLRRDQAKFEANAKRIRAQIDALNERQIALRGSAVPRQRQHQRQRQPVPSSIGRNPELLLPSLAPATSGRATTAPPGSRQTGGRTASPANPTSK